MTEIRLDEREAQHTIATGKLDGVLIKMNIYVLRKNYCIYDLTYSAKINTYDVGVVEFERFVAAFHAW
ncbi:MAG: hypothetical protein HYS98_07215 [Deltaproteobacteria bacterium]|nr:hypothetical protein [Deltaproteobacteria bacterium]